MTNPTIFTVAEKVALLLNNDGQCFEHDGKSLDEICADFGSSECSNLPWYNKEDNDVSAGGIFPEIKEAGTFDNVYIFDDGSFLAVSGGCWDISDEEGTTFGCCIIDI